LPKVYLIREEDNRGVIWQDTFECNNELEFCQEVYKRGLLNSLHSVNKYQRKITELKVISN
jgi:hypothetical protein